MFLFSSKSEIFEFSQDLGGGHLPALSPLIELESKYHVARCLSRKILQKNAFFVFMYLLFPPVQ